MAFFFLVTDPPFHLGTSLLRFRFALLLVLLVVLCLVVLDLGLEPELCPQSGTNAARPLDLNVIVDVWLVLLFLNSLFAPLSVLLLLLLGGSLSPDANGSIDRLVDALLLNLLGGSAIEL